MDDRFLSDHRREPRPAFARALRERLRGLDQPEDERARFRLHPALAGGLAVAAVAIAFSIPAVRAVAQSALDLFRVRSFAAVEVDPARLDKLRALRESTGHEPFATVFGHQEVLQDPGKPTEVGTLVEAAEKVGWSTVRAPSELPGGLKLEHLFVTNPGAMRITVASRPLEDLVQSLGLTDVHVPPGIDGQTITVRLAGSVIEQYANGPHGVRIVQGASPTVTLPPGVNLEQLGEIGLRILGLDADEAQRTARAIDWRNTLVVPVPTNAATFRQVTVNGHDGLLITTLRAAPDAAAPGEGMKHRPDVVVMWSEGEGVAAVMGDVGAADALTIAQSIH